MKKLLFLLLLVTSGLQSQTLQSPTYGNTTTNTLKIKTPATVTSVNFLSTIELDGSVAKVSPVNLGFASDANVLHKTGDETKIGKLNQQNLNLYQVVSPVLSSVTDSGTAGILNGTYYYSVTYYTATGETDSSNELSVSVVNKQVTVTIPVSSNPLVVGRKIYRTIANPFDPVVKKLVTTISNNTATSYTDNLADGSLGVSLPRVNNTGGQLFVNSDRVGFANSGSTSFGLNSYLLNTGYANTGFGFGVLTDNTDGYRNTGSGVFSLYKNTLGFNNSGFGVHTLNYNTTGYDNNAFGFSSALNNITGHDISSFGSFAASTSTNANFVSAFGNASLQLNTASNNSAFGYSAAKRNNTGTGGTFIGTLAGEFNTTGNFNTSVGDGSMKANSTGSFNAIFGFQTAFNGASFGTSNSFFGSQAGYNATGSSGVFLGKSAGYWETGDNKLFIDNANRANESDGRLKALIYGQFDASTANQFLNVNGTLNSLKSRVITPLVGSTFLSSVELLRENVLGGVKMQSLRNVTTGGVGLDIQVTADNSAETSGTYTSAVQVLNNGNILIGTSTDDGVNRFQVNGGARISSLAGTGTRQVQVDASGTLSATGVVPVSGTYNPVISSEVNTTSATISYASYSKIENVVTVSISGTVNLTNANTYGGFHVTLPFNRATSTSFPIGISAIRNTNVFSHGWVVTDSTSDATIVLNLHPNTGGSTFTVNFMYNTLQ